MRCMRLLQKNMTLISRFVIAFVCLNLGGALCLTYCSQGSRAANASTTAVSSHCQKHRAKSPPDHSNVVSAEAAACCSMPVSLIAAPIERSDIFSADLAVVPERVNPFLETLQTLSEMRRSIENVYRPPPLDHRTDRLRNCVFRI